MPRIFYILGVEQLLLTVKVGKFFCAIFKVFLRVLSVFPTLGIRVQLFHSLGEILVGFKCVLRVDKNVLEVLYRVARHKEGVVLGKYSSLELSNRTGDCICLLPKLIGRFQRIVDIFGDFKRYSLAVLKDGECGICSVLASLESFFVSFYLVEDVLNVYIAVYGLRLECVLELYTESVLCSCEIGLLRSHCESLEEVTNLTIATCCALYGSVDASSVGVQRYINSLAIFVYSANRNKVGIEFSEAFGCFLSN